MRRDPDSKGAALAKLEEAYFSARPHEQAILDNLAPLLEPVRVFVDIGASLGQYTRFANGVLRGARIFAIEADPLRFEELRKNCGAWQDEGHNRITPIHAAVAEESGSIPFFTTGSDVSGGLFLPPGAGDPRPWAEIEVPAITLDEQFASDPPDLVKIDVEGAEGRVLRGARRLLAAGRTAWLVELHGWNDPVGSSSAEDIYRLMEDHGYHGVSFHGADLFRRQRPTPGQRLASRARRWARRLAHAARGLRPRHRRSRDGAASDS